MHGAYIRTCNYRSILSQHSFWHKYLWNAVDTGELLEGIEKQLQVVSSLPTKIVEDWDIYISLSQSVATIQTSVPMLEGLKRYIRI